MLGGGGVGGCCAGEILILLNPGILAGHGEGSITATVCGSLTLLTELLSFSLSRNMTSCWGRGCQAQVMLESPLPAALLGRGQS